VSCLGKDFSNYIYISIVPVVATSLADRSRGESKQLSDTHFASRIGVSGREAVEVEPIIDALPNLEQ